MVEWKHMWEVTTWDKKFTGVDKSMQPDIKKYHYYLANELTNLERPDGDIRILYTTDKIAYAHSIDVEENVSEGEVVAIPWGGNVSVKYYKGRFITADNRIATSNNTSLLNNKFLYYWMLSQKSDIESFYRGAGIKHPSMFKVLNMLIPIPSLSEQQRIVSILDTFTSSISNLKQQIEERRKQYEYERDLLLDLEGKEGVEMKKLGEVCTFSQGIQVPVEQQILEKKEGYCRFLRIIDFTQGEEPPRYVPISDKNYYVDVDDIAMVRYGSPGFVCVGKRGIIANNLFKVNIINSDFVTKLFLACLLKSKLFQKQIKQKSLGGALQAISFGLLRNIILPFPPLPTQFRIVSILDTFEQSISNLEEQLAMREKQYEYYRNQLLTFEGEEERGKT